MDAPARSDSDEAIQAIADPIERALRLRAIARDRGNLTPTQSRIYGQAIAEIRGDDERKQIWIARKLDLSRGRIAQILGLARKVETVTEAAA